MLLLNINSFSLKKTKKRVQLDATKEMKKEGPGDKSKEARTRRTQKMREKMAA